MTKKKEDRQTVEDKITELFYDAIVKTLVISPDCILSKARSVARGLVVELTSRNLSFNTVKRRLEDSDWGPATSMLEDTVNDLAALLADEFIDCCEDRRQYNNSNAQNKAYFALKNKR